MNSFLIVFVVFAIAAVYYYKQSTKSSNSANETHNDVDEEASLDEKKAIEAIESVRSMALAYALYEEMIEHPIDVSIKKSIYEKYGHVTISPTLDYSDIVTDNPHLCCSRPFLNGLSKWLNSKGIHTSGDYFSMSAKIGDILVTEMMVKAQEIIQQSIGNACG